MFVAGVLLLQLLVGFADKLRLLSVLMDDLKSVKEVSIAGFHAGIYALTSKQSCDLVGSHTLERGFYNPS